MNFYLNIIVILCSWLQFHTIKCLKILNGKIHQIHNSRSLNWQHLSNEILRRPILLCPDCQSSPALAYLHCTEFLLTNRYLNYCTAWPSTAMPVLKYKCSDVGSLNTPKRCHKVPPLLESTWLRKRKNKTHAEVAKSHSKCDSDTIKM